VPAISDGPLTLILLSLCVWGLIGIAGLVRVHSIRFSASWLFPSGAVVGLAVAAGALWALWGTSASAAAPRLSLPLGLPNLPVHLRLDALSAVFLVILGGVSAGVSTFASAYFRKPQGSPPGLVCLEYHLFLASMGFVLIADDAYGFLVAWEMMAMSSYFLVITDHRIGAIRDAGFLYLVIAHAGALAILCGFALMWGGAGPFTFEGLRAAALTPAAAGGAFLLFLVGFGAKAGLVPFHVWLPEAHPAAPSPVSALMSGVMLKMAVYGMLRVSFDLLRELAWWWGLVPIAVGLFSALYGIVFAAAQTDMKRLLAYSSIDNLGILFTALGLALVFHGAGMPTLAALALLAALYHAVGHAFTKSLLFLGTGSVLHATGERNLGRLGGLIHRMPWVAWLTLVGALALAGLPPLSGFVSEWLLLQAFLFSHEIPHTFVNMLLPLGAALVALVAALAGYVMVKFYGVIFLGQPRESDLALAHDPRVGERGGLAWLAAACVLLGLLPAQVSTVLARVGSQLHVGTLDVNRAPWWMLVPLADRQASYAPLAFLFTVAATVVLTLLVVRRLYRRRVRLVPVWDCGFGPLNARMQDTAEGFGQPIRQLFEPFFVMVRHLPSPFDAAPRYRVEIADRIWNFAYLPLRTLVERIAGGFAWLQHGRISLYLIYGFVTLVVLLALVL
jgi:formate hydrogenlyase subunit 3/multisubunit Na+/H+ antiporter MnhD subunit